MRTTRRSLWSLLVVVLVAVNLRPAVVAVSPVLGRIRADLDLSATAAGLLTTIPVLCFGALAPAAAGLARRRGLDLATVVAVAVLGFGSLVRLVPGTAPLFLGTVLIGAGIAVGNVVVPAVVKLSFTPTDVLFRNVVPGKTVRSAVNMKNTGNVPVVVRLSSSVALVRAWWPTW